MLHDTIAARITGPPPAAVAVVRLSGPDAFAVAARLFEPWPSPPEHGRMVFGRFEHGDEGYGVAFDEGRSYTTEPTVELHVHGSQASVSGLLAAACRAGARLARPGEFTLRAFLHGRIDLAQAEGVAETVAALTERQARQAAGLRTGALSQAVKEARDAALRVLASVEASTDFPDEVGELDRQEAARQLERAERTVQALLQGGAAARVVREGFAVVVCGLPNAGKSSLFNRLLGEDRAIVTPEPGTTRDEIEAWLSLEGVPVRIYDVAGLRDSGHVAERTGVERARRRCREADLALYVFDQSRGWSAEDERERATVAASVVEVANKADLPPGPSRPGALAVSAQSGEGVAGLVDAVRQAALAAAERPGCANERHRELLAEAAARLAEAKAGLAEGHPSDLAAVHLAPAVRRLSEVLGEEAGPDVLDAVFREFCIGK